MRARHGRNVLVLLALLAVMFGILVVPASATNTELVGGQRGTWFFPGPGPQLRLDGTGKLLGIGDYGFSSTRNINFGSLPPASHCASFGVPEATAFNGSAALSLPGGTVRLALQRSLICIDGGFTFVQITEKWNVVGGSGVFAGYGGKVDIQFLLDIDAGCCTYVARVSGFLTN